MLNEEYLNKALKIATINSEIEKNKITYEKKDDEIYQAYVEQRSKAVSDYWNREEELKREKQQLMIDGGSSDDMFYIGLGDIIDELVNILKIDRSQISFEIIPDFSMQGAYTANEIDTYIKMNGVFNQRIQVAIKWVNNGEYGQFCLTYDTDYNMPQADGFTFAELFYVQTSSQFNQTHLRADQNDEELLDILIAIPYQVIANEADKYGRLFNNKGECFCRYDIYPTDLVNECIVNCVHKREYVPTLTIIEKTR